MGLRSPPPHAPRTCDASAIPTGGLHGLLRWGAASADCLSCRDHVVSCMLVMSCACCACVLRMSRIHAFHRISSRMHLHLRMRNPHAHAQCTCSPMDMPGLVGCCVRTRTGQCASARREEGIGMQGPSGSCLGLPLRSRI